MSYILDALKRAERERKQGQVSVLDEVPATAPEQRPRGRSRPWLWLALGAAGSGLLVYALTAWHRHPGPASSQPPAAPSATAAASTPAAAPVAAPPPAPAAAPPPAAAAVPAPAAAAPPAASATIENPDRIATVDDVVGARPPPHAAAQQESQPPPAQAQAQAQAPEPEAAAPPQEAAPPAESAQAPAAADEMPALKEMPDSYRAQFPQIAVDVHAYDASPQRRFVLINGKRYKEGDTLAEGPRIVAIVAEGIVFDWQGHKVLYATGR